MKISTALISVGALAVAGAAVATFARRLRALRQIAAKEGPIDDDPMVVAEEVVVILEPALVTPI